MCHSFAGLQNLVLTEAIVILSHSSHTRNGNAKLQIKGEHVFCSIGNAALAADKPRNDAATFWNAHLDVQGVLSICF
jgi:hypothetical protein